MADDKSRGLRLNNGKVRLELVPETLNFAVAKVLEAGMNKYDKNNWRKGLTISSQLGCLNRHLKKFESPHVSDLDKETQLHEMMMVACNVAMIIETLVQYPELDDRFNYVDKEPMSKEEWIKLLGLR